MKSNRLGVIFSVLVLCSVLLLNAAGTSLCLLNDIASISFEGDEISSQESTTNISGWYTAEFQKSPCFPFEIEENEVKDADSYSSNLIVIPRELKDPSCLSKYYSTLDKGPFSKDSKIYLLYHSLKLDC